MQWCLPALSLNCHLGAVRLDEELYESHMTPLGRLHEAVSPHTRFGLLRRRRAPR
jgi:hypothetical protein